MALEEYAQLYDASWVDAWATDLAVELASISPYPETVDVLAAVRTRGLKTAVASNLALPCGQPVATQLGAWLDVMYFSFEMGAVKPDAAFYLGLCRQLDCEPSEILMIGDTWRCDYAGATAAGLRAMHLDRHGNASLEQKKSLSATCGRCLTMLRE